MQPNLFFRDDTPETVPRRFSHYVTEVDHIIYLHINGQFIWKHGGYRFSEGCMSYEGGMVAHIWPLHTTVNRILVDCEAALMHNRAGIRVRSGLDEFITQEGFVKFVDTLQKAGWEYAAPEGWHKDVWTDDD